MPKGSDQPLMASINPATAPTDDLSSSSSVDTPGTLLNRHQQEALYTRIGARVLVAMHADSNRSQESLSKDYANATRSMDLSQLSPHLFSLSSSAYLHMTKDGFDQSILLMGESGSGKSKSRRLLIRNLCDLGRSVDSKKKTRIHSNILKVDTILTAFGHASTPFNTDATCLIPYTELQYNQAGQIAGLKLIDYALEKSRVTGAHDGGRSFHIFHDLFEDLSAEDKEVLQLTDPAHFHYLADSLRIRGPADRASPLTELKDDLKSLGIGRRQQASIFKMLAAILHLGNIFFIDNTKGGEAANVKNPPKLELVASFLGVEPSVLEGVLTFKMKKIGRDTVSTFLDVQGAQAQRDCLARALYAAIFSWIVEKLNDKLCQPETDWVNFVTVLDLPGIAGTDVAGNGFQRLLINYANERLHYLAMENLAGDWKNKYLIERISVSVPRVAISRQVLDLLTSPRFGILTVIQSETAKGSNDEIIAAKIVAGNEDSSAFLNLSTRSLFAFGVRHYTGVVEYDTRGFAEVNSDVLQGDFVSLIRGSPEQPGTTNAFLRSVFSDSLIATTTSARDSSVVIAAGNKLSRYPSMKRKKNISTMEESVDISSTVGHQFQNNYEELLKTLVETQLWYVFHIQPCVGGQGRPDPSNISRQTQAYNFNLLKSHPALKYSVEMTLENFTQRFGVKPSELGKEEILVGKTSVFLTETAWMKLEKSIDSSRGSDGGEGGYAASEQDDETASHYGSEFEHPRGTPGKGTPMAPGDIEMGKFQNPKTIPKVPKKPMSGLRCRWLACVWASTFCYFPFCLRICGRMKDKDRQIAWREKVALCLIIFLMNAFVLFFIVGIGVLLCPPKKQMSPGQVSANYKLDENALIYMYGNYYSVYNIINDHANQKRYAVDNSAGFWENKVLGKDAGFMFPKDHPKFWNKYCPTFGKPSIFSIFPTPIPNDLYAHTRQDFLPSLQSRIKGVIVWDKGTLAERIAKDRGRFITAYGQVYDVTGFYTDPYSQLNQNFMGEQVKLIFDRNSNDASADSTGAFDALKRKDYALWVRVLTCMNGLLYVGEVDHRNDPQCTVPNYILLGASVILVSVIGFKFFAALQCKSYKEPEDHDKFAICQVPCYTEGETSLTQAINSLATMTYDDKHKLIFIICDGMIIGSGNDRPTPRIVLDILGVDPNLDPEPLAYQALGDGNMQLNYAKIYSGLYEMDGHTVPFIVVVKVGKPSERQKPGNRGKRDSQLILMRFLSRVHFNQAMSPLEIELYHQMKDVVGVDPSFYEYVLMVDADTKVFPDALSRLVSHMIRDTRVAGTCGETQIANERASFTTMIQVYEYFISHHMAKAFESLFATVTCLPGCFSMYRIRSTAKNIPVITSPALIKDYSENTVDTLHLRNLLHLGEDRYLTTLILKHFPNMKTTFTSDARCLTNAPDKWSVLLSQRRRWINSTIHNLMELLYLQELCGFCCFSMRFVVFIDLLATIVGPSSLLYIIYIIFLAIYDPLNSIPYISIGLIAAIYGFQIIIFLFKAEWQHIGWMLFYILATPIFGFYIPLYSFWHFDDFSWGNTRVIVGENGKKKSEKAAVVEPFDPASVPLRPWSDFAGNQMTKEEWETKSVASFRSENTYAGYPPLPPQGDAKPPTMYMVDPNTARMSYQSPAGAVDLVRRRSIQSNRSEAVPVESAARFPSDEELLNEIRHILSTSDLMTITKKKVRQQLSTFFGVDLSSKKEYIHSCIDSILKGEL